MCSVVHSCEGYSSRVTHKFAKHCIRLNYCYSICLAMSVSKATNSDMGDAVVRAMRREDAADVHRMIHDLAAFEGMPDGPKLSVQDVIDDGFNSSPAWFFGLVVELGGRLVGYALCNRAYSSWTRRAFYVEDLYVEPAARRRGIARVLMQELCKMALEAGVHRIDWHVLQNNVAALRFYARLGVRDLRVSEGRAALRLDRPRIEAVAGGDLLPLDTSSTETTT